MSNSEILRAWKDPQFRATLGDATPDHPAGQIVLPDQEPESNTTHGVCSVFFCTKRGCA